MPDSALEVVRPLVVEMVVLTVVDLFGMPDIFKVC